VQEFVIARGALPRRDKQFGKVLSIAFDLLSIIREAGESFYQRRCLALHLTACSWARNIATYILASHGPPIHQSTTEGLLAEAVWLYRDDESGKTCCEIGSRPPLRSQLTLTPGAFGTRKHSVIPTNVRSRALACPGTSVCGARS
jgi:hypothetical protein